MAEKEIASGLLPKFFRMNKGVTEEILPDLAGATKCFWKVMLSAFILESSIQAFTG